PSPPKAALSTSQTRTRACTCGSPACWQGRPPPAASAPWDLRSRKGFGTEMMWYLPRAGEGEPRGRPGKIAGPASGRGLPGGGSRERTVRVGDQKDRIPGGVDGGDRLQQLRVASRRGGHRGGRRGLSRGGH